MPILEAAFEQLRGSSRYFPLDFLRGFWQLAMTVWSQEIYFILTEEGVITPTRVPMGGTNSVAYVQSTVQEMFAEVFNNGLIIWIDDLLGTTTAMKACMRCSRKYCKFMRIKKGLPLNTKTPTTGQELQRFVRALNWMGTSLPGFNKLIDPLVKVMEKVYMYEHAGGRKKPQVHGVQLCDVEWSDTEVACIDQCKSALQNVLQLAHPDPEKLLTVYTDTSDEHWGAAIAQIPRDQATRPISEKGTNR
ncbi:unnamed protein product [Phytophthora fragariaefolia]|uniref:Unnamed protein product n=1 Tax=Phytophthora fragariaefolia TaxID=1490495 RepID=A0A9W6XCK6_9STRA|nr:unnamed protein product [Phytophthora fragariaefolia]